MPVTPPRVKPRTFTELVRDTRATIRRELQLPAPTVATGDAVPGDGLVHIFARLSEIVVEHLNRVPEKNLMAFLAMLGLDQAPPRAARVPLTFRLASGAARAQVPTGTAAAATAEPGEAEPPAYETERDLVVTATELLAAYVREPALDRYRVATAITAPSGADVPIFVGDVPIEHELYVGDALFALAQPKEVRLSIEPYDARRPWPHALAWSYHDGTGWRSVSPEVLDGEESGVWQVLFAALPGVAPIAVGGQTQPWLRARLTTPLPPPEPIGGHDPPADHVQQSGLPIDAAAADATQIDARGPLAPFGTIVAGTTFHLACERAFTKPGARVTLNVEVDRSKPATETEDLELTWSVFAPDKRLPGGDDWLEIGVSRPSGSVATGEPDEFVDGTHAFTGDGAITFTAPASWSETEIGETRAHWLRVTRTHGAAAPLISHLTVGYRWPQPPISQLTRRVEFHRIGVAPDRAVFGTQPLDLSKDFKPFGDTPRRNDVFYVACDEAFSLLGANIWLTLSGTKEVAKTGAPDVAWEVLDGKTGRWVRLTVGDGTEDLTNDGTVGFVMTAEPTICEIAGERRFWLRARLVDGDYGADATMTVTDNELTVTKASWDPPSIGALSITYKLEAFSTPDMVVARNDFNISSNDFSISTPTTPPYVPFEVTADRRPTLYLAAGGDFANEPTGLFFDVVEPTYTPDNKANGDGEPPAVVWEYRAADGWRSLGTRDETRSFSGRGLVSFVAPADMRRSTDFGVEAWWLRARWDRGSYRTSPRLARVLTNTIWATNVATIRDEILGSGTGDEHQRFQLVKAPILPGQRIEVRERGALSATELAAILAEEGEDAVSAVSADATAEAWVRWHPVVDFHGSGPRSRHYVLDRLTGEVRFGDGRRGMAPPPGRGNVRVALYRTGGGAFGNRPAGAITELSSAVPYVDGVSNVVAAGGGADAESLASVRERGPRVLRHGNRAVTVGDIEDLALDASPSVAHVLGVPATGSRDGGSVGLIVVPASDARQPLPSLELLDQVRVQLEQRLPLNATIWVAGPGWMEISVTAEVVPVTLDEATDVRNAVRARLDAFLHPLTASPRGGPRPFGRTPRRSDLIALIETVPGVDHVRALTIARTQTVPEPAPGAVLAYSGEHAIAMASSTDDPSR
jgi:hypothetical protein